MAAYNHHSSSDVSGGALGLRPPSREEEAASSIPRNGRADASWVMEEPKKEVT